MATRTNDHPSEQTDRTDDTEEQIRRLSATGDLLDVARQMRAMGVESLLFAGPDGRIAKVVTDRQIAHLAGVAPVRPGKRSPDAEAVTADAPTQEAVPAQGFSAQDQVGRSGAGVSRR